MKDDNIQISYTGTGYSSPGYYDVIIYHKGTKSNRTLYGKKDSIELNEKIRLAIIDLNNGWRMEKKVIEFNNLNNLLKECRADIRSLDFEKLKDSKQFTKPIPVSTEEENYRNVYKPTKPDLLPYPHKLSEDHYQAEISFFDKLIPSRIKEKIEEQSRLYEKDLAEWKITCQIIDSKNQTSELLYQTKLSSYERRLEELIQKNNQEVENWKEEKKQFELNKVNSNLFIESLKQGYFNNETNSIIDYCGLILNQINYPEQFPKNLEFEYNSNSKILIIDYSLPVLEDIPTMKETKYVKGICKEYHISDTQRDKLFELTLYNITLRTLHELFQYDEINALEAISFNGWVNAVNKATGKKVNNCILSIQVKKAEFLDIDLTQVDPKISFKNLRGISSSKLIGMTPVQPIMNIDRKDKRFTSHYDVAEFIDDSTNLAAMEWEDFEHLIREVFEKEFSSNGGEVKVTQASRDGGVDAIAFDPDPIKGGKIIIQAKRYTNTVGLASVRDLYGTVMNEGANKGILVTTADYGPDAYEFIKGKNLTLINGANLLYLLEKHGHKAKIDIAEAKRILKE